MRKMSIVERRDRELVYISDDEAKYPGAEK